MVEKREREKGQWNKKKKKAQIITDCDGGGKKLVIAEENRNLRKVNMEQECTYNVNRKIVKVTARRRKITEIKEREKETKKICKW